MNIKRFNDMSINEEYYGGPLKDLMLPRVDELINYLEKYKKDLNSNSSINDDISNKVERMWYHLIHDMPLEILASSSRQAKKVRGEGETLAQRAKRSLRDF